MFWGRELSGILLKLCISENAFQTKANQMGVWPRTSTSPVPRSVFSSSLCCARRAGASLLSFPCKLLVFLFLPQWLKGCSFIFFWISLIQMCCQMCSGSSIKMVFAMWMLRLWVILGNWCRPGYCECFWRGSWLLSQTSVLGPAWLSFSPNHVYTCVPQFFLRKELLGFVSHITSFFQVLACFMLSQT